MPLAQRPAPLSAPPPGRGPAESQSQSHFQSFVRAVWLEFIQATVLKRDGLRDAGVKAVRQEFQQRHQAGEPELAWRLRKRRKSGSHARRGNTTSPSAAAFLLGITGAVIVLVVKFLGLGQNMNQRALDEMRHRTGMDSWLFYVWAIPSTLGAVLLTWLTFRNGISALMADPKDFYLWLICTAAVISFWYPRRKQQGAPRRPNPFSVMPGWVFYVLAIPASAGTAFMTWYVFRYGVVLIIVDPTDFYLWLICLAALATLWRARPKKPKDQIRLNLE